MSIAYTSRLAYRAVQNGLAGLQREVWQAIASWPGEVGPSIQDLAEHLDRKESSICGRINELRAAGAIEDAPIKIGACGKPVKTYRALLWRAPVPAPGTLQLQLL